MRLATASLPLVPLRVGDVVDRAAWVPHVTVLPNARLEDDALDALIAVAREVARDTRPLEVVVGAEARFGPAGDVLVDLVDAPGLRPLHDALLAGATRHVEGFGVVDAMFARSGFRPHRTVVAGPRPARGARLGASSIVVAELEPPGFPGRAVVAAVLPLGGEPEAVFEAEDVVEVLDLLTGHHTWVIGGWGVDALGGRATRSHHDLDLLVDGADADGVLTTVEDAGFVVRSVWSENRWSGAAPRAAPSAYVARDDTGRELDVHVVDLVDGVPVPRSASNLVLPAGALDAVGRIGGRAVPTAGAAAQLAMHTGYALPPRQEPDVALLRTLLFPFADQGIRQDKAGRIP